MYRANAVLLPGTPAVHWPAIPGEDRPNNNLGPPCSATTLSWVIAPRAYLRRAAKGWNIMAAVRRQEWSCFALVDEIGKAQIRYIS